jgi:hypothetical protein
LCGFAGLGRRTFGEIVTTTVGDDPEAVAVGDFNNDGHFGRRGSVSAPEDEIEILLASATARSSSEPVIRRQFTSVVRDRGPTSTATASPIWS